MDADGFFLGAQASNPTVDLNGNAVTAGDWYFNTGDNTTRIYDGSAWNTVNPDLVGDTSPQLGGNLDLNSNDITGTGNVNITGNVDFVSTDAGSSASPEFTLFRNSASPADGDYLGQIKFDGKSDTGTTRVFAKITGKVSDVTNGTEDGLIETAVKSNGSNLIVSRQTGTALKLINSVSLEVDGTVTASGGTSTNWNTAYGWGDHSTQGYLTGNETITLTGAVTGSGTTSIATTLSTIDGGTY